VQGNQGWQGLVGPQGNQGNQGWQGTSGALFTGFDYDADTSSTTDSDPGTGLIRWNNATQTSATELYVDDLDKGSHDHSSFYSNLGTGDRIRIQAESDAEQFQLFEITGVTDQTGYFRFDVSFETSEGVDFSNLDDLILIFSHAGSPGVQGPQGNQGNQGFQGTNPGAQGAQGPEGPTGTTGVQGNQGNQGWQGLVGTTGATGPQGAQGNQGWQGLVGTTGSTGPQGAQGNQGWQGVTGSTGAQGNQGLQGDAGATGAQGNQGWQGVAGSAGATGAQGNQGWQGLVGTAGTAGVQGNQGNQGWQGWQGPEPGNTNTLTTTVNGLTTIATIAVADDTVMLIEAFIVGRRTDAAARASYIRKAVVYREGGGSATLEGSVQSTLTRESVGGYNATIIVSGTDALIQVDGAAGHTINWESTHVTYDVS
jgi:hypothetical protein